jgi:hypothetical protein
MTPSHSSPQLAALYGQLHPDERRALVAAMFAKGRNQKEISGLLGINESNVSRALDVALPDRDRATGAEPPRPELTPEEAAGYAETLAVQRIRAALALLPDANSRDRVLEALRLLDLG